MRRAAAVAFVGLLLAGCSSHHGNDDVVLAPPAAEFPPPQVQQENDARLRELQTSMTELLERLDVMNDRLNKLEASQTDVRSERQPAAPTPAPVPAPAPAAIPVPAPSRAIVPPARADVYTQYRNALVLYGKNRWVEARNGFQQIFDAEPTGELADNALFWIGETYYAAGDYHAAMRYYGRVINEYPNENKAPDALFKTGLAYVKTGDLGMARKTFEDTIRRYPYATAAASAKAELARIKY